MFPVRGATAQASADAFELDWDAPDECGDERRLRAALSQRLGERTVTRSEPIEASATIERTSGGFSLVLETDEGQRRIEAASCDELVQSAAVILALLIDPQAPVPVPDPQPESAKPRPIYVYVRPELVTDLGLMPNFSLGPGFAGGLEIHRTLIELSGTYLPTQSLASSGDVEDTGDLRAFIARLGACQMFGGRPGFGACGFLEYAHFTGRGGSDVPGDPLDVDGGMWSLLLAARLSIALGNVVRWTSELGIGLPTIEARFKVSRDEDDVVHETSAVVGRVRTGFDLRF